MAAREAGSLRSKVGNLSAAAEVGEVAATGVRDQRGHWTYAYTDFRGSTRRTLDELGHATRYRYDAFGTLALIEDPHGNLTRLRTDKLGRLLEHEDANTGLQEYAYTAFDELFSHTDGPEDALRVRKHSYDEMGRLVALATPEGPTSFSYDGPGDNTAGRLVETMSPSGTTEHYEYQAFDGDPMKNAGFVEEVSRLIDGNTYTTKLGYDPSTHQLDRVEYPASGASEPFAVRYAYDGFGNVKSVKGTSLDRTNENSPLWQLDEAYQGSLVQKETFGNAVSSSSYTYEQATGRLKTLVTRGGPGNVVLQNLSYDSYDNSGNLKSRQSTFKRVGSNTSDTFTESFNYDELDRLDDYTVDGATADVTYDDLGNIKSRTGIGNYSYFDLAKTYRPHAVLGLSKNGTEVADFAYDDYGNIKHRSGEGVVGGTQEITHTSFNLPSTITLGEGAGASQIHYEYDAGQKRVLLAVGDCGSSNNPTCNKRVYVGDSYERQTATDAGGPVTRHAYKVFAGSRQVAQIEREQRSGATVETRRFLHGDHLGSSQVVTNELGELTHVQRLDPFGAPAETPGSPPDASSARIRTGFTGHETDVETGLVNMRGRLYDARIGRFMQADPPFMESPGWSQGLNRYSYVFNNPLNAVDPSGFEVNGPGTFDHAEDGDGGDYSYFYGDDPLSLNGQSGGDSQTSGGDEGVEDDGADTITDEVVEPNHDSEDEEAETAPSQGDPTDESGVGGKTEGLRQVAAARHDSRTPVRAPEPGEPVFLGKPLGEHVKDTITFFVSDPLLCILGSACGDFEAMIAVVTFGKGKGLGKARKLASVEGQAATGAAKQAAATVLQSGGNTISKATAKALGLTSQQARDAMHKLKPFVGADPRDVGKIMSNDDYVSKETGEILGNLFDFVD